MSTNLAAKCSGQFGKVRLLPNIVAGVIVGVVALPLAMACMATLTTGFILLFMGVLVCEINGPFFLGAVEDDLTV